MASNIFELINSAISLVVTDFQANDQRFWEERDLHWSLFYYLKQESIFAESYPTQLLRAEFPTKKLFGDIKPSRGHYDLVILDKESYYSPEVKKMNAQTPWKDYLEVQKVNIAVEIKLWLNRLNQSNLEKRVDWDIQKLTDTPNMIGKAYFLNFVQLDFRSHNMEDFYKKQLRDYLILQKKKWPSLNILCVPSDQSVQPDPMQNWL